MSTVTTPIPPAGPEATRWLTTRILFTLAGAMTLISALLAATLSPWWLLLAAFVGLNQLLFVGLGACPASIAIDRLRTGASRQPVTGSVVGNRKET